MDEDTKSFVRGQIDVIDRMLFNAYGTVYKIAAKYIMYKEIGHQWSEMEELLCVKNLLSNLWSVLDYCCILLYAKKNNIVPNAAQSRKISVPCHFGGKPKVALVPDIENAFKDVQYKNNMDESIEKVKTFYWLHFLRNIFSHKTILMATATGRQTPQMLANIQQTPEIAIDIRVPEFPWNDDSCNQDENYHPKPLLDLLFNSCELVENKRDEVFTLLKLENSEDKKFSDRFEFHFSPTYLRVTFGDTIKEQRLKDLHFTCYGLEKEFQDEMFKTFDSK